MSYTIFGATLPANISDDGGAYERGLVFRSYLPGHVTGVRFYKGAANTGTHVGHLWSMAGVQLGAVTFSGETSSGWQEATFATPIAIAAHTPYIISCSCPNGNYALSASNALNEHGVNAGPLRALARQESALGNGVYNATPNACPDTGSAAYGHYYVDVLFEADHALPLPRALQGLWTTDDTPSTVDAGDGDAYAMGVKFKTAVAGFVSGVRFYKSAANTGTHVGRIWSNAGVDLASVTFADETASGWQEATFPTLVPLAANTTYCIAVGMPNGHYSRNSNYFTGAGRTVGDLYAYRSNEVASGNGVYLSTLTNGFPSSSYNDANYWVDVRFFAAAKKIMVRL
jgi:hypothetical protein